MNNNKIDTPKPDEKICYNCKNLLWLVGIGQGIKCDLDKKSLSSRWYTCDKFVTKHIDNNSGSYDDLFKKKGIAHKN
jgi:hypothetical protein